MEHEEFFSDEFDAEAYYYERMSSRDYFGEDD